jgi:hypothetical protein
VERIAVQHLLDGPRGWQIREPWQSAWRLIEESWEDEMKKPCRIINKIRNVGYSANDAPMRYLLNVSNNTL